MTAVIVSPHLDDAVFGCGEWLAEHPGARVVTVFAGAPADPQVRTDWDAQCGFAGAGEAMQARRDEDARALAIVGAVPHWLGFRDSQYADPGSEEAIGDALVGALSVPPADRWLVPMGLFHSDHALAHAAALRAASVRAASGRPVELWMYEEALYRQMPGLVQRRLAALCDAGIEATPVLDAAAAHADAKARAVAAYRSQARAFGPTGLDDTRRPERFWRLRLPERPPLDAAEGDRARWPTPEPASSS